MKSSFNYEFIDCLQPRCGANRGEEMILYSFSPRNMDSLCTRHVVSEGTYFRAVLSFVFKKKTRPSYDLSSRRDRPFFPPPRKIKTGPRTEIHTCARTQSHTFRVKQRNARNAASEWAMVHMGNECSVANGTCPEHPPVQGDPLHWPEAMRRPWNRLRGCVRICCVRT